MLMGISTFLVAFLPGYASIGIWRAVILTILRLLEGIGVGGEWGGPALLSMEWVRHNHERGVITSWPQLGGPGPLIATALFATYKSPLPSQEFDSGGFTASMGG